MLGTKGFLNGMSCTGLHGLSWSYPCYASRGHGVSLVVLVGRRFAGVVVGGIVVAF